MARVKQKDYEDFSDEKVLKVIAMLENKETKKACCDVLGMSYNTSRLSRIIQEYQDKVTLLKTQKAKLRGTAVSKEDCSYTVQAYLNGEPLNEIANNIFRSIAVVKNILIRYNVPLRSAGSSYFDPVFLKQEPADDYVAGDLVYSARYITPAVIVKKMKDEVYRIYLQGSNEQYAYQPYYELGDLRKIQKELGVSLEFLSKEEINNAIMEARRNAKKKAQKK